VKDQYSMFVVANRLLTHFTRKFLTLCYELKMDTFAASTTFPFLLVIQGDPTI